jgi:ribosomal protein S18 acetylase RimI-like enzyme
VVIRDVDPGEHVAVGELLVHAYRSLGDPLDRVFLAYEDVLRDVAARTRHGRVLVAARGDRLLGTVTYAPPGAELSETDDPGAATIRMLAVDPAARHRGVGEALVRECVRLARADGCTSIVLLTRTSMTAARRLYERLGFVRDAGHDARPGPGIELLGFRLPLT